MKIIANKLARKRHDMNKELSPEEIVDLFYSLPFEERQKIFSKEVKTLEKLHSELENEKESKFHPHEAKAWSSLQKIIVFYRKMTGYNCGWVAEEVIKHCSNAGREKKYNPETRLSNSIIIDHICKRGCSPRQATILLAKIIDDVNVSQETMQKELTDTYREYRDSEIYQDYQKITDISWVISNMLNFDLSKEYTSKEAAFSEAIISYKAFWQEIIDLMKQYHPIIAKHDKDYPKIFGCVIEWLNENYKNPLEYFYKPISHKNIPLSQRRYFLTTYLEAINYFQDIKEKSQKL